MNKSEQNIEAAKLCGIDFTIEHDNMPQVITADGKTFNIFTNPADREATVIALLDERIFIRPNSDDFEDHSGLVIEMGNGLVYKGGSYNDSIAIAAEVSKKA